MALIKCPNCNNDLSDKAIKCPKCGSQIKKVIAFNSIDIAVIVALALYCVYALLNIISFVEKMSEVNFVWQLYYLAIIIYYIGIVVLLWLALFFRNKKKFSNSKVLKIIMFVLIILSIIPTNLMHFRSMCYDFTCFNDLTSIISITFNVVNVIAIPMLLFVVFKGKGSE